MTGEAPMGIMAPSMPHQIPVLRIDGWMIQPQDGSSLTAETKARVAAFKGDLFVIADKYEWTAPRAALAGYGLAVRWLECGDIETNLGGQYQILPGRPQTGRKAMSARIAVLIPCYNEEAAIAAVVRDFRARAAGGGDLRL